MRSLIPCMYAFIYVAAVTPANRHCSEGWRNPQTKPKNPVFTGFSKSGGSLYFLCKLYKQLKNAELWVCSQSCYTPTQDELQTREEEGGGWSQPSEQAIPSPEARKEAIHLNCFSRKYMSMKTARNLSLSKGDWAGVFLLLLFSLEERRENYVFFSGI